MTSLNNRRYWMQWNDYPPYLNSQDKSKVNSTVELPSWPVQTEVERSLASTPYGEHHSEMSPPAAMEPPVFPVPSGMESARVGETQQNILLEVLGYCRFLHAAVQRLEQKIDDLQSKYRTLEVSEEPTVAVRGGQLSWSIAQRLGPSPQTKLLINTAGGRHAADGGPQNSSRKWNKRRKSQAQEASEPKQEAARDAIEEDPRDNDAQKKSRAKHRQKRKKQLTLRSTDHGGGGTERRAATWITSAIKNKVHKSSALVQDHLTPAHVMGH